MLRSSVTKITLAVDKYNPSTKQREADFISVVIWGKQAESTANYMIKGSLMAISGKIQTRAYDAKDGTERYLTEVVAQEVSFLEGKKQDQGTNNPYGGDIEPVEDSGDIPF